MGTTLHLVSLLSEKQGSTFANFLDLFYPLTLLTNSALVAFVGFHCAFQMSPQMACVGETLTDHHLERYKLFPKETVSFEECVEIFSLQL